MDSISSWLLCLPFFYSGLWANDLYIIHCFFLLVCVLSGSSYESRRLSDSQEVLWNTRSTYTLVHSPLTPSATIWILVPSAHNLSRAAFTSCWTKTEFHGRWKIQFVLVFMCLNFFEANKTTVLK